MSCHTPWRLTRTLTALRRGGWYTGIPGTRARTPLVVIDGMSDTTAPPYCSDSCGGSGHVTSHGAPGCWGTSRRAWRHACHCSRVVPGGTGASGSMIQSVSTKRRFRSARREAQAWASRSASISACVRHRISATDDHLQVVGPEAFPYFQLLRIARARRYRPKQSNVQLSIHSLGGQHRAGVKYRDNLRRLAVGEGREVEAVGDTIDRRRDALAVKRVNHICIRALGDVGNAHHFHTPIAL